MNNRHNVKAKVGFYNAKQKERMENVWTERKMRQSNLVQSDGLYKAIAFFFLRFFFLGICGARLSWLFRSRLDYEHREKVSMHVLAFPFKLITYREEKQKPDQMHDRTKQKQKQKQLRQKGNIGNWEMAFVNVLRTNSLSTTNLCVSFQFQSLRRREYSSLSPLFLRPFLPLK